MVRFLIKRKVFIVSFFLVVLYNYNMLGQKVITLDTIENTIYLGKFKLIPPSFFVSKYTYDPLIDKYIYTNQCWDLQDLQGICSCIIPSYLINNCSNSFSYNLYFMQIIITSLLL